MKPKTRSMGIESPGKMSMWEFDFPQIGPEDGLLKVEMAGVCGSDPGMYRGKASALPINPKLDIFQLSFKNDLLWRNGLACRPAEHFLQEKK